MNSIAAKYHGTPIYIEKDDSCEKMIISESFFRYISQLEKDAQMDLFYLRKEELNENRNS